MSVRHAALDGDDEADLHNGGTSLNSFSCEQQYRQQARGGVRSVFTNEVSAKLGYYVYRLIDPRNGETFYVGKGKGNRVFAHANGAIEEDATSEKLRKIYEIKNRHFEVQHVIHRHGLDEATAFEVEAALIDAYPSVTNIVSGHSADRGVAHAEEICRRYEAKPADIIHAVVEININRSVMEDKSIYDAARFAWKISAIKASKAEYVLAVDRGIVVGVFKADGWYPANDPIFGELARQDIAERYGFVGQQAPAEIANRYLHHSVPPKVRGAANPIRYHNL